MDTRSGRSSRRARCSASSPHGYQSTGLSLCCSRYGEVSCARRLDILRRRLPPRGKAQYAVNKRARKGLDLTATRESITAPNAPEAIGPYVHAVAVGELLFCSGQIPLDPRSGEIVGATPADQAGRCLENLAAVCQAAGATLGDAVRLTVYLTDMGSFAAVNEVYESFFESDPPARVALAVAALPRGALVGIDGGVG